MLRRRGSGGGETVTEQPIGEAIPREYLRQRPDEAAYADSPARATVEADLRCRVTGPHGAVLVSDMPAGVGTRVRVLIGAPGVSQTKLRELVHRAREHSPVDDAMQRAVPVTVEIETGAPA